MRTALRSLAALALLGPLAAGAAPQVLQVGTWHGVAGPYLSVQAAVDAAQPGDWILVGPGTYHEHATRTTACASPPLASTCAAWTATAW